MSVHPDAPDPGLVALRRAGHRLFIGFLILFVVGYVTLGVVLSATKGTGSGFGDTRTVDLGAMRPESESSVVGNLWRIGASVAVLAALPALWCWFLRRLGDFGHGSWARVVPSEERALAAAQEAQRNFPMAHRLARDFSIFGLVVLLLFGNFFMPYVVIRWGWGVAP